MEVTLMNSEYQRYNNDQRLGPTFILSTHEPMVKTKKACRSARVLIKIIGGR